MRSPDRVLNTENVAPFGGNGGDEDWEYPFPLLVCKWRGNI